MTQTMNDPIINGIYSWQNSYEEFGTTYKVVGIESEAVGGKQWPPFTTYMVTVSYYDKDGEKRYIRTPWDGTFKPLREAVVI
jgi:hypothetical protein